MTHDEIAVALAQFEEDPRQAMNQPIPKEATRGQGGREILSLFSDDSVRTAEFIPQRDQYRRRLRTERKGQLIRLDQILPGRAPFEADDLAEDLVDTPAA